VKGASPCTWEVVQIDPATGHTVATITVGREEPEYPPAVGHTSTSLGSIAAGDGSIWVAAGDLTTQEDGSTVVGGAILQIDPATNKVVSSTDTTAGFALAVGERGIWAIDSRTNAGVLVRIEE